MRPTNSQFYSALTKFTALNGLNTYYFNSKRNKFCGTWKLKMYCLIHHVLCVLALGHMFYDSAGSMRLNVTILTLGGTTRNRLRKMAHCLKLYSKVLELCDQFNYEYGHVSVCVLACKSWFQITYGYEIFQIVAAPKSLDLSLSMRLSMFTLKLAMHPKRVFLLNLFSFDRKLTLALIAKSTLYTICWLQGDYKKLKP
ncbi:hypothetical protein M5D96_010316 [Drosophila gunungcola]|uniref:Uncharacterized protein n=1 Tax=Drosophila gunungcola TaxID=103775 RepID=A0A9P9YHD2_9MUSC|nr:hypothetical protein M5D96_010316 [Drosophila gunungcola]